jgi:hypothetical protein
MEKNAIRHIGNMQWSKGNSNMTERPRRIDRSLVALVIGVGMLTLGTWVGPTWEGIAYDAIGMASLVAILWLY